VKWIERYQNRDDLSVTPHQPFNIYILPIRQLQYILTYLYTIDQKTKNLIHIKVPPKHNLLNKNSSNQKNKKQQKENKN